MQRTLRSNNSRRFIQKFKTKVDCKSKGARNMCIPELTTETFLDTILDPTKVSYKKKINALQCPRSGAIIKEYIKLNGVFTGCACNVPLSLLCIL